MRPPEHYCYFADILIEYRPTLHSPRGAVSAQVVWCEAGMQPLPHFTKEWLLGGVIKPTCRCTAIWAYITPSSWILNLFIQYQAGGLYRSILFLFICFTNCPSLTKRYEVRRFVSLRIASFRFRKWAGLLVTDNCICDYDSSLYDPLSLSLDISQLLSNALGINKNLKCRESFSDGSSCVYERKKYQETVFEHIDTT